MFSIKFKNNRLFYLDQTKLPLKEVWKECRTAREGYFAITQLQVRGAPLIGVFAGYAMFIAAKSFSGQKNLFLKQFSATLAYLRSSRPTAVNLFWALERIEKVVWRCGHENVIYLRQAILKEAIAIHREDVRLCERMAGYGVSLIHKRDTILTHCNSGFLATSGEGTALAVIYEAHKRHKGIHVYADETRPLLQGARLTAWELTKRKVPCTLICDNMAASLMQRGLISKVFVGADRIAANGDAANKIGTYNVAVIAHYHHIPFYVVAPFSTFDLTLSAGSRIPIEQRAADELRRLFFKTPVAARNVRVYNPAFDVTPACLISAIVSDKGIIYPPYTQNISKTLRT
ncbi:MAG: S-methyl-5-thioribose-1-phosphate isomerase [Candidatus Omnitrophota bacterium]